MAKKYNIIENSNEEILEEVMEEIVPVPELEETAELETQETETDSDLVTGIVTNCVRLNIRKEPSIDAPIITEVNALSELMIDLEEVDEEWYSVCTEAGIEGFCMKKFVAIKQ